MIGRGCDVSRMCDFIFRRCVFQQLFGMAKISMLDTGEHLLGTNSIQPLIQWKHFLDFEKWHQTAVVLNYAIIRFTSFEISSSEYKRVNGRAWMHLSKGKNPAYHVTSWTLKSATLYHDTTYVWSGGVYCIIFCDSFVQVFLFCILDPSSDLKWIS